MGHSVYTAELKTLITTQCFNQILIQLAGSPSDCPAAVVRVVRAGLSLFFLAMGSAERASGHYFKPLWAKKIPNRAYSSLLNIPTFWVNYTLSSFTCFLFPRKNHVNGKSFYAIKSRGPSRLWLGLGSSNSLGLIPYSHFPPAIFP